ncbi:hypothetical protein [Krasilnikovia sp. M28-CT-15]|uniref:hypothetical protein n=1 Tax=Krasilnikovia sp. M28-CT-15 TaxID=3373540 RepID=UPI003876089C
MRARTALVTAGIMIMGYAVGGALNDPGLDPGGVLLFLAAVLIGHDAVWMPAVLAVGGALARFVPPRRRKAALSGAIVAAALTVVAIPLVLGFGRPADNPSALPLPYGRNLGAVLLLIAGATLLARRWPARESAGRKDSERPGDDGPGPGDG